MRIFTIHLKEFGDITQTWNGVTEDEAVQIFADLIDCRGEFEVIIEEIGDAGR